MAKSDITKNITKPVLKLKRKNREVEIDEKSKNFDLPAMDDFSKISYDKQLDAYNAIKNIFVNLREKSVFMDEEMFNEAYSKLFFELLNLAVTGNVAAMDYMCFTYKKGIDGILASNLTLAHKWGMLAVANGSKLSVERLRMFLDPVFDYVDNSDIDIDHMIESYDLTEDDAVFFVAQMFAGIYNQKMGITLLSMAQENPASVESNFKKFNIESTQMREQVLPELLRYLK